VFVNIVTGTSILASAVFLYKILKRRKDVREAARSGNMPLFVSWVVATIIPCMLMLTRHFSEVTAALSVLQSYSSAIVALKGTVDGEDDDEADDEETQAQLKIALDEFKDTAQKSMDIEIKAAANDVEQKVQARVDALKDKSTLSRMLQAHLSEFKGRYCAIAFLAATVIVMFLVYLKYSRQAVLEKKKRGKKKSRQFYIDQAFDNVRDGDVVHFSFEDNQDVMLVKDDRLKKKLVTLVNAHGSASWVSGKLKGTVRVVDDGDYHPQFDDDHDFPRDEKSPSNPIEEKKVQAPVSVKKADKLEVAVGKPTVEKPKVYTVTLEDKTCFATLIRGHLITPAHLFEDCKRPEDVIVADENGEVHKVYAVYTAASIGAKGDLAAIVLATTPKSKLKLTNNAIAGTPITICFKDKIGTGVVDSVNDEEVCYKIDTTSGDCGCPVLSQEGIIGIHYRGGVTGKANACVRAALIDKFLVALSQKPKNQ